MKTETCCSRPTACNGGCAVCYKIKALCELNRQKTALIADLERRLSNFEGMVNRIRSEVNRPFHHVEI